MKNKIFTLCVVLVAACYATFAHAYLLSSKTIKKLHVNTGSGIYFQTNEAMQNPHNCASASWYIVARNSNYEKEVYSLLLAARASGAVVSISIDGCEGGYPKVAYVNTHD